MNVPKVSCRVVLLLAAVLCAAAEKTDMKEESVKKSAITQNQSSIIAILKKLEARVEKLEAKRIGFFRGRDGRDGIPGKPGIPGRDGRDGARGTRGSPGSRGRPGRNGQRGAPGPKGDRGPGGVEYVRWGRITCGGNASLVYKGRIGGERYTHNGGAVNYVCLPEIPKYGRYKDGHQIAGYMYGTEYEVRTFNPFTTSNLHDHEAPCAVCYVQTRSAKLMIPATYECPAGWTREYHGYLMTEYHNHAHPREFICVDQGAEAVPGTHANVDGALLYPVEGVCGSLPCQPYVEGRQLTCTVCTK